MRGDNGVESANRSARRGCWRLMRAFAKGFFRPVQRPEKSRRMQRNAIVLGKKIRFAEFRLSELLFLRRFFLGNLIAEVARMLAIKRF
jgi:hypothetical protein